MGLEGIGLGGLLILIADVYAIIKTLGSTQATTGSKVFWIILILLLPILASYSGILPAPGINRTGSHTWHSRATRRPSCAAEHRKVCFFVMTRFLMTPKHATASSCRRSAVPILRPSVERHGRRGLLGFQGGHRRPRQCRRRRCRLHLRAGRDRQAGSGLFRDVRQPVVGRRPVRRR